MTTLVNHSTTGHFCPSSDTEDELLLSPGKQETYMRTNHSKRSASPIPDEYSHLSGSPPDSRKPKRAKRDLELEESESDRANLKLADVPHQRLAAGHARSLSDSDVLVGKRSTRKRSATSTKKPVSSVSPSSSTFSPVVPTEKGRAQSVPLFASFNDTPRIDFRNPPSSPKRSRSRSPSKYRELKFRKTSTPFTQLGAILDETSSAMEMVVESGSTLKATEVLLLPKIDEETQPTASINEIDLLSLPTPTTQVSFSEVLSTPLTRQSLNTLIPMSPLTPLPETPFPARLNTDAEDRSLGNTGSPIEVKASEQTTKPLLGIVASTSRSRLPRPSLVPPISDVKSSSTIVPFALPASKSFASIKGNAKTAKKKEEFTVPKQDAFTAIMAGQRMKQKAEKEQKEKVLYQRRKAGPSTFTQPLRTEKPKFTAKDRMRGKQNEKPQKTFVPDEEEEDSHSEVELTAPTEDHNRFVASSKSPEPYISAQNVKTSMSEDATCSETKVKSRDTIMLEQKTFDDGQMPLIGDIEATTSVPSEKVVEAALLQPSPAPLLLEENASGTNESTTLVPSESGTLRPKLGTSKLPRRKRRQPSSAPIVDRVTRSAFLKQKEKADIHIQPDSASASSVKKGQAGGLPVPAKRTASGSIKEPVPAQEKQLIEEIPLPPGSPMKLSSPAKSTKSTARDTRMTEDGIRTTQTGPSGKTPAKSRIPVMPVSSPSPSKLARTISRFSLATDISGLTRSFSMDENNEHIGAGSSLSTLSNALEKLRMPPPSRPNTSMGFNRDGLSGDDDDTSGIPTRSRDDETVGRVSSELGRSESGLKRAVTLGASSFKSLEVDADVSSSKTSGKPLVQKSLAMFMNRKTGTAGGSQPAAGATMRSGMRPGLTGKGPIFGGGLRRTISKKTSLPSVMASPVKGGGAGGGATDEIMQDTVQDADQDAQSCGTETVAAPTNNNDVLVLDDLDMQGPFKGKEKEKASTFGFNPSRRVSMISVSHSLSQSLNSLPPPQPKIRGIMGPPETPPAGGRTGIRSSSSTYPSTSGGSPSQKGASIGTRSSARIANTATSALSGLKSNGGTDGHVSSGRKGAAEPPTESSPVPETLKILTDCIIFVDVRTDDGVEAGSLFIDMLGGVGARVLARVGQTCTHIVFKNGLMSTLTRYRMLRDPKPLVVGIAWVVECVEQRKRVDETKFLVDVEDIHYGTGTSKRRRSMLPRSSPSEMPLSSDTEREDGDADQSMDGSSSSMIIEVLPPLELARRRKSMLLGPRP